MTKIFISYRRADSIKDTGRVYDRLRGAFGEENLFRDMDNIPFGSDFEEEISAAIAQCAVVLVVMGRAWLTVTDHAGRRRLDNAADYVRIEVETALKQGKLVIPVLVDGAHMPAAYDLPESLAKLALRNAATVRDDPDFHRDMDRLIKGLESVRDRAPTKPQPAPPKVEFRPAPQLVPPKVESKSASLSASAPLKVESKPAPQPTPQKDPKLETFAATVRVIIGGPFEWCDVPAGEFIFGEEKTRQTLDLPRFAIAKYPITYAQFQRFIDASDGFKNPQWWAGLAADAEHKQAPGDQQWKIDKHPRECISWYEAIAFCRWLSFKLGGIYAIGKPAEWLVRLPIEAEWEKAARGTDGCIYPWGNQFDKNKCNTYESGIGKTTPSDQYPNGASPYGALDMSGNVWEWCLSTWTDPYEHRLVKQATINNNDARRGLRGGSWYYHQGPARAASRNSSAPDLRFDYYGFRLCAPCP